MEDPKNKSDRSFTATEVGTLIDSFRNDISVVAEEVRGLSGWRKRVDGRLETIESRLTGVEDAVRVAVPDLFRRVTKIEAK